MLEGSTYTILADCNRRSKFGTIGAVPKKRVQRMRGSVERTTWPDQSTSPYCDQAGIKEYTIEVYVYSFADPTDNEFIGTQI